MKFRVVRLLPGESFRIAQSLPRAFAKWAVVDAQTDEVITTCMSRDDARAEAQYHNER